MNELTNNNPSSSFDLMVNIPVMEAMYKLAETMASGRSTVPAHLQGNTADCMAIVMQAAMWKMNPFAVAQKTHFVGSTIGYEAQLVNAVVSSSGLVSHSFDYEFYGPWNQVIGKFKTATNQSGKSYQKPDWTPADEEGCGVRISNTLNGDDQPKVLDLLLSQAQVRNSTLWASDPKQQLAYLAVKRWARLYCPAAILGVYTVDELESKNEERDVTPGATEKTKHRRGAAAASIAAPDTQSKTLSSIVGEAELSSACLAYLDAFTNADSGATLASIYTDVALATRNGEFSEEERAQLTSAYRAKKSELAQLTN
ncbi:RecT family recombinase [Shewanella sp.]|uniref:RecT family recombinase n=1 Tax=Shewanella sp. TaxID=50422 RepID=UPI003F36892C